MICCRSEVKMAQAKTLEESLEELNEVISKMDRKCNKGQPNKYYR